MKLRSPSPDIIYSGSFNHHVRPVTGTIGKTDGRILANTLKIWYKVAMGKQEIIDSIKSTSLPLKSDCTTIMESALKPAICGRM